MIIRSYNKCNVCKANYLIRYGVSDQFPQSASFFCTCGEKLSFGYTKKKEKQLFGLIEGDENETATVMNLHSELIIDKDSRNDPAHFPTVEFIIKQARKDDPLILKMRDVQRSIIVFNENWDKISTDLRLVNDRCFHVLEAKYGSNHDRIQRKIVKKTLEISKSFLVGKWNDLYDDVYGEFLRAKRTPGYAEFKKYLTDNTDKLINVLYTILSEYSEIRSELLITLIAQKCDHNYDGISSSVEWTKIEKIYGDFFEIYGDLLAVITGINNLLNRGSYSLFQSEGFTFERYLESDKANRCNNFLENERLKPLSDYYDSGIRNGTHHKNSKIDKSSQEIILGVGKGGGTERKISFVNYIYASNEIFARMIIVLNIAFKAIYS